MISHYPKKLVSLPKSDLRTMSEDSTLPFSGDTLKDKLIKNASNVMTRNEEDTVD